jgi:uncharacterized protein YbjT (DUF2867 family)
MHTSIVAGATGLVGGHVLRLLAEQGGTVLALTRRPIDGLPPGAQSYHVDFEVLAEGGHLPAADHVYICLGTTIRKAGSRQAFRRVDHDYVVAVARAARAAGATRLSVVSSVGANATARNTYLKIKGEVEQAIAGMGFDHVSFIQPGLLLGDRDEKRLGEKIATLLTPLFNPLLLGGLAKYKSVAAETVARAMIEQVRSGLSGVYRLTYPEF